MTRTSECRAQSPGPHCLHASCWAALASLAAPGGVVGQVKQSRQHHVGELGTFRSECKGLTLSAVRPAWCTQKQGFVHAHILQHLINRSTNHPLTHTTHNRARIADSITLALFAFICALVGTLTLDHSPIRPPRPYPTTATSPINALYIGLWTKCTKELTLHARSVCVCVRALSPWWMSTMTCLTMSSPELAHVARGTFPAAQHLVRVGQHSFLRPI